MTSYRHQEAQAMMTILTATERQQELAIAWHGGQSSMLYAVASTGALSTGTHRPRWNDGEPMTDDEWGRHLAGQLADELHEVKTEADRLAADAYRRGDSAEAADLMRDADVALTWGIEVRAIANADMAELQR